jgi:hypothetical protein
MLGLPKKRSPAGVIVLFVAGAMLYVELFAQPACSSPSDKETVDAAGGPIDAGPSVDAGPAIDAGGTSPIASEFCAAAFGAIATKVMTCCTAADKAKNEGQTLVAQTQGGVSTCNKHGTPSESMGRIALMPTGMAACKAYAAAINAASCYDGLIARRYTSGNAVPVACRDAIVGKQQIGQPCVFSGECVPGGHCVGENIGVTPVTDGTCQPPAKSGEACEFTEGLMWKLGNQPECEPGLVCGTGNTCVAGIANGNSCTNDALCLSGICSMSQCQAALFTQGMTCTSRLDCEPQLQCATNTCQPDLPDTSACGVPPQCRGLCSGGVCGPFCGS